MSALCFFLKTPPGCADCGKTQWGFLVIIDNMLTLHAYRMNRSSSILDSVSPVSGDSGDGGDFGYCRAKVVTLKFHTLNLRGRLSNRFLFVQMWESLLRRFEGDQLPHYHGIGVTTDSRGPSVHLGVESA